MITFKTGHSYIPINTQKNPKGEAGKKKLTFSQNIKKMPVLFMSSYFNTKLICATAGLSLADIYH